MHQKRCASGLAKTMSAKDTSCGIASWTIGVRKTAGEVRKRALYNRSVTRLLSFEDREDKTIVNVDLRNILLENGESLRLGEKYQFRLISALGVSGNCKEFGDDYKLLNKGADYQYGEFKKDYILTVE